MYSSVLHAGFFSISNAGELYIRIDHNCNVIQVGKITIAG